MTVTITDLWGCLKFCVAYKPKKQEKHSWIVWVLFFFSSQFPFLGAIFDKVCLTLFFTTVAVSILMRLIFRMYNNGLKYFLKRHSYLHSRAYARHCKPLKSSEKNKKFIQKLFQLGCIKTIEDLAIILTWVIGNHQVLEFWRTLSGTSFVGKV